ncbi:MAG: hypothetical protein EHM50_05975 [Lysobacterales bacterium]|nr:MAG: hypothetical protein EHM50_05975 [Xanthomonadales bacterium]
MPNRREFLQTGAAVSAIAANGVIAGTAAAVAASRPITLRRAIYDDRYVEGRRFAEIVSAHGVPTRSLDDGDITRFWYDELEVLWKREPVAVAGFTQFGPMFVVERLALERGLNVVLRVEHRSGTDGTLEHCFTGPRETLALASGFETLHSDWPGLIAALACTVGGDDSPRHGAQLATAEPMPRLIPSAAPPPSVVHYYTPHAVQQGYGPALDGPLYSWVVAPRASLTR